MLYLHVESDNTGTYELSGNVPMIRGRSLQGLVLLHTSIMNCSGMLLRGTFDVRDTKSSIWMAIPYFPMPVEPMSSVH